MFVFAHLGIGSKLVSPWSKGIRKRAIFFGALLPDMIDKSLYYGLVLLTGKHSADLGLIAGTRTFGHTGLFLLLIVLLAWKRRSPMIAGIALGVASHLFLDCLSDYFRDNSSQRSAVIALVWPLRGFHFGINPYRRISDHIAALIQQFTVGGEIVGLAILAWDYWQAAHRDEILESGHPRRRLTDRT